MTTGRLAGRRAIVAGGSRGLGLAVARAFVLEGARVMLAARDAGRLGEAREELARLAGPDGDVRATAADVTSPADVQRAVDAAAAAFGGLDALVCCAAVHGSMGPAAGADWAEWRRAIEVNLLGSVLLCRAALGHFLPQRYGKIVLVSGGGATGPRPYFSAYAASKAAVVRFGETLAEEVRELRVDVNAVAPGAMNTQLLDEIVAAGPERVGSGEHERALRQQRLGGTSPERGAALCVFLASAASDGITGRLISAVWDPWEALPGRREELAGSDIYTLRRIVPADRGLAWS